MDPTSLSRSYWSNSTKEELVLNFVGNFTRQFRLLYNNRKPLFIVPPNECGKSKFACTSVRPTLLPYRSLYDHDGAAAFVASYLTYEPLKDPTDPPEVLPSPSSTLWNQRGNCFDFSVLLCSLLEGAGYDAYVVHGYATREVCFADRSRREIADEESTKVVARTNKEKAPEKENKYKLKPVSKLSSDYEKKMSRREEQKENDGIAQIAAEAEVARKEKLRPPHDELGGLRVHSWVVVLRGKRGVPETFFVEPTLGEAVSAKSDKYLGIEAMWNSKNYWVNMQDCTNGCVDLHYSLGDSSGWEYVFPHLDLPAVGAGDGASGSEVVDLPPSWVDELSVEPEAFESKCPHGTRVLMELGTKTEVFAEYLKDDGMVKRVTRYADAEMKETVTKVSTYAHRKDRLVKRLSTFTEVGEREQVDEHYLRGRPSQLQLHTFFSAHAAGTEDLGRRMKFYHDARVDGLEHREDAGGQLRETFVERDDFLVKRVVKFEAGASEENVQGAGGLGRRRSVGPVPAMIVPKVTEDGESDDPNANRIIVDVVETYLRNPAVPADEDIKEVTFCDEVILVTYHKDPARITAQSRELDKPQLTEKQQTPPIQPDEVSTFKVDPTKPPSRNFENSQILDGLKTLEEKSKKAVQDSFDETKAILERMVGENRHVELELSFYDTTRNAESKARRERIEDEAREETKRREEMERDYLAPFITQQIQPSRLNDEMDMRISNLLGRGRLTASWRKANGDWSPDLLELYEIELECFVAESRFNEEERDAVMLAWKKNWAHTIKRKCLEDLQLRLERQARLIQEWFDSEKTSLQEKKDHYEKNQGSMKPEQKDEYANSCEEIHFRLKILDFRLARHKDEASKRYVKLDHTLRNDKRLADYLKKDL